MPVDPVTVTPKGSGMTTGWTRGACGDCHVLGVERKRRPVRRRCASHIVDGVLGDAGGHNRSSECTLAG